MLDGDGPTWDTLAECFTQSTGFFCLGPVPNNNDYDEPGGQQQDILFRVLATNDACWVTSDSNRTYEFFMDGISNNNHPSGLFTMDIPISQGSSGSFFVSDVMRQAHDKWLQFRPSLNPGKRQVIHAGGLGTCYDPSGKRIMVEAMADSTKQFPDTFDRDVLLHEYGHLIADTFLFFLDSTVAARGWCTHTSPEKAVSEAWAHFWSAYVRNNPRPRINNYYDSFTRCLWFDVETGGLSFSSTSSRTANTMGRNCEGAVAGILWDIFDDTPNEDQSGRADWGDTTLPHHPDGVSDTLANGITNILNTLLDRTITDSTGTHHPRTLDEFWTCWFQPTSFGHPQAMRDIRWEHGDSLGCCLGIRGNANGDPDDLINVADLTFLIEYLFRGGPVPPCPEEGDVNGYSGTNVSDITQIIAFLFRGGPAPEPCP